VYRLGGGLSSGDRLNLAGNAAEDEFPKIDFLARVVDVDSDQVARDIVVEHDTFGDFAALDARLLRKVDVENPSRRDS
jgi:hypothetical protein